MCDTAGNCSTPIFAECKYGFVINAKYLYLQTFWQFDLVSKVRLRRDCRSACKLVNFNKCFLYSHIVVLLSIRDGKATNVGKS